MDQPAPSVLLPSDKLYQTLQQESHQFCTFFTWLERAMQPLFFEEMSHENLVLITRSLMGFEREDFYSTIHLKRAALVLCLDSPDADLKILEHYRRDGVKHYQVYTSLMPPPIRGVTAPLHVALIEFTETTENVFSLESREALRQLILQPPAPLSAEEFDQVIGKMSPHFLRSQSLEYLALVLNMYARAKTQDGCQYEVRYHLDWNERGVPSMQVILAWKNPQKNHFLYRLAQVIQHRGVVMKTVNATYVHPYATDSILLVVLGLQGINGQAVWEMTPIVEFLRELTAVKSFPGEDLIEKHLVRPRIISGSMGHLLRAMHTFIHQTLVHVDPYLYTFDTIEEDLCRHPELTAQLCEIFDAKFHPAHPHEEKYRRRREALLLALAQLDTGHEETDTRRRNVLQQGLSFIHHTLKTNFYRVNITALSFRLDPRFLEEIPFERTQKFPELPFGIFFIKGLHFFGYHIRFRNTARGGLRTLLMEHPEHIATERNHVFMECYHLAYTQQMKNKDIPEGGAKGLIFVTPFGQIDTETHLLASELKQAGLSQEKIAQKTDLFRREQKAEFLYQAQRAYIESLLTIVNCEPDGLLRAKRVIDYWKRPEYLYLGPDENMGDPLIVWIAHYSKKCGYAPGGSFISGKPREGINHKEYGVTSLGVQVYLEALLRYLGIDPTRQPFTVKMTGGPDGDVAGNVICLLHQHYPHTAKLIALADATGAISAPQGVDLGILVQLFQRGEGIRFYPPEKLTGGAFLLDKFSRHSEAPSSQQTLLWTHTGSALKQEWLSSSAVNQLLRMHVHQTPADVFIPAGGRPRTLNESNYTSFLDETGTPTAKAIVEGANLYLTQKARRALEELGVLIIKDSSANKTGVICSSFEVLCGLALGDEGFYQNRDLLIPEILERLKFCAEQEARLLLETHQKTGRYLTDLSDLISDRINQYTDQLLSDLESRPLDFGKNDSLTRCYLNYCLPTLRHRFRSESLNHVPEPHQKAIIAAHVAAQTVYARGLEWHPTIVDLLPLLFQDERIMGERL